MSREIKFRAWDGKRMWCIEELDFRYQKALEKHALDMVDWSDIEIMQFTGLLDKNGVEIYEGDIIEWVWLYKQIKDVVEWDNKRAMFATGDRKERLLSAVTVIGNIHEHGHLLND